MVILAVKSVIQAILSDKPIHEKPAVLFVPAGVVYPVILRKALRNKCRIDDRIISPRSICEIVIQRQVISVRQIDGFFYPVESQPGGLQIPPFACQFIKWKQRPFNGKGCVVRPQITVIGMFRMTRIFPPGRQCSVNLAAFFQDLSAEKFFSGLSGKLQKQCFFFRVTAAFHKLRHTGHHHGIVPQPVDQPRTFVIIVVKRPAGAFKRRLFRSLYLKIKEELGSIQDGICPVRNPGGFPPFICILCV